MITREVKIEHFKNLIAVAYADGILDEEEKKVIHERAVELGLNEAEVSAIIAQANDLSFIVPLNHEEKEDQLADIIYMSMIDGKVHPKEYSLCKNIAKKLDLNTRDVDHVIKLTSELWKA